MCLLLAYKATPLLLTLAHSFVRYSAGGHLISDWHNDFKISILWGPYPSVGGLLLLIFLFFSENGSSLCMYFLGLFHAAEWIWDDYAFPHIHGFFLIKSLPFLCILAFHLHTKRLEGNENWSFGKLRPDCRYSETLFVLLTCKREKVSFWAVTTDHALFSPLPTWGGIVLMLTLLQGLFTCLHFNVQSIFLLSLMLSNYSMGVTT